MKRSKKTVTRLPIREKIIVPGGKKRKEIEERIKALSSELKYLETTREAVKKGIKTGTARQVLEDVPDYVRMQRKMGVISEEETVQHRIQGLREEIKKLKRTLRGY